MTAAGDQRSDFQLRAKDLLEGLLRQFDAFDPDEVEAESSEGVVKLAFADGSRCVLNRQSAANQMWLAEGATAWHFEFDPAASMWRDTKGRGELTAILSQILSRRLGRAVALRPA